MGDAQSAGQASSDEAGAAPSGEGEDGLQPENKYEGLEPENKYEGLEPENKYEGLEPENKYEG